MEPTGPPRGNAGDRLGRSLSSRPYVTAGAVSLLLLVMWNSGRDVFDSDGEHGWLAWVVVGFVLYALIGSLVVLPRSIAPKMLAQGQDGALFLMGLAFAVAPFLVAFATAGAGADTWTMALGFVALVVMLFLHARTTASRRSTGA